MDWHNTLRPLLKARLRDGRIHLERSLTHQSYKDVQSERFILHRFSTLSQAVASIRLSGVAWAASGYRALAKELLDRGRHSHPGFGTLFVKTTSWALFCDPVFSALLLDR